MPRYDYHCDRCGETIELIHSFADLEKDHKCDFCRAVMARTPVRVAARVMGSGWEYLNGGRGEYISQLETVPNGKKTDFAHCRSHNELAEKAASIGMDVNKS